MPKLLLKARPTPQQLEDRMRPPVPDGLELYLDHTDIGSDEALAQTAERLTALPRSPEFPLILEGPIYSLDRQFFDVARQSEADAEVVHRLVQLGRQVRAVAINVHAIAPRSEDSLTLDQRGRQLERSVHFLTSFARRCTAEGIVPTVENMPAVLQMRQGGSYYSAIGMLPDDLVWLAEQVPGLQICLDVSHAQLVVNAQHGAAAGPLAAFLSTRPEVASVEAFLALVAPWAFSAHISNAAGLADEGLPYGEGDLDLDPLIRRLARCVEYLVTETLEPDPNEARFMRDAQQRITRALEDQHVR